MAVARRLYRSAVAFSRRFEMSRNLYSGEPWSEMDIADLQSLAGSGVAIEDIAELLLRDAEEVRKKAACLKIVGESTIRTCA
jgi:hypothetical protein